MLVKEQHNPTLNATGRLRFIALSVGLFFACLLSIGLGSLSLSIPELLDGLFLANDAVAGSVIWQIRIPRTLTAVLAGVALAVSGLQMQTLFYNPLAGPSVLGISAGASLGVATVMLGAGSTAMALQASGIGQSSLVAVAAIVGAAAVLGLLLLISRSVTNSTTLLIVGLMIGNFTIATVSVWQYFSQPEQIREYLLWTFGHLGGVNFPQLLLVAAVVLMGMVLGIRNIKAMNMLLLGEESARSMGQPVQQVRQQIIISTSLLTGIVTCFCGPIAFIGIAVPHLCRNLFGTADHRIIFPACILVGALLLLVCDIAARLPGEATALPVNIITAMIGAPVVALVIIRQPKGSSL